MQTVCRIYIYKRTQTSQNKEYVNVLHHAFMNWWVCVLIGGGGGVRHFFAFFFFKRLGVLFKWVEVKRGIVFC